MSTISVSTTTTTAFKITTDTTGTLVFQTGASPTTAVTFDGSQNVGIGFTPSSGWQTYRKAVQIGASGANINAYSNAGDTNQILLAGQGYADSSGVWKYTVTNGNAVGLFGTTNGAFTWSTASSGTAGNTISFTQIMTLDASGNLNIGTTSSDIAGGGTTTRVSANNGTGYAATNVNTGTATYSVYQLGNNNSANRAGVALFGASYTSAGLYRQDGVYLYSGGAGGVTLAAEQAQPIYFATNNTERMRLDSSGNLGLGTTSPSFDDGTGMQISRTGTATYRATNTSNSISLEMKATNALVAVSSRGSYPLIFETNGTERMRVNAGAPILCLSGGSTSATGTGIAFPATQSSSSDANTLDDYEEGSWTPSLRDGGTNRNPTYSDGPSGTYVKIGRFVFVRWGFKLTNKGAGSGSGEIQIHGLPFTPTNTGSYQEENVSVSTGILNTAANAARARMVVSTSAYLFGRVADNADTIWTYADLTNTSWIIGEVCYIATA